MPVSPPLREANLERLTAEVHDVLVVGAGINGAVSAAALTANGVRTALVDRGDFGGATSQESSNLVWGGIKYLERLEFPLVWRLCRSRNELMRSYPTNIREIRFFAPIEHGRAGWRRRLPLLWAGSWIYWLVGRCHTRPPRILTRSRILAEAPAVDASIVKGGIEFSDAYLVDNDARFVFGFVRDALARGAAAANYVEVSRSERGGDGLWRSAARDRVTGREMTVRARVLLNAAGPWVDDINAANGVRTVAHHLLSKGIHLVVRRIPGPEHVLTFFDETDRMFFVIPMGPRSVIGTTDTRVDRPETEITDTDRRFLFENLNRRLRAGSRLGTGDIVAERCGVRPLAVSGSGSGADTGWTSLSRQHVIEVDRTRATISIFGGKLTDCLNVGESIADLVRELGVETPHRTARWYGEPPDAGRRAFLRHAEAANLDAQLGGRLWRRYGASASGMLQEIGADPRLALPLVAGSDYRRCELLHAARSEMVVRLEDLLRRRTEIALILGRDELRRATGIHEACEVLAGDSAGALFREYFGAVQG